MESKVENLIQNNEIGYITCVLLCEHVMVHACKYLSFSPRSFFQTMDVFCEESDIEGYLLARDHLAESRPWRIENKGYEF